MSPLPAGTRTRHLKGLQPREVGTGKKQRCERGIENVHACALVNLGVTAQFQDLCDPLIALPAMICKKSSFFSSIYFYSLSLFILPTNKFIF